MGTYIFLYICMCPWFCSSMPVSIYIYIFIYICPWVPLIQASKYYRTKSDPMHVGANVSHGGDSTVVTWHRSHVIGLVKAAHFATTRNNNYLHCSIRRCQRWLQAIRVLRRGSGRHQLSDYRLPTQIACNRPSWNIPFLNNWKRKLPTLSSTSIHSATADHQQVGIRGRRDRCQVFDCRLSTQIACDRPG